MSTVFSPDVISQLNDLPATERVAVTDALTAEFVDTTMPTPTLTPFQRLIFVMMSDMIRRGSLRHAAV